MPSIPLFSSKAYRGRSIHASAIQLVNLFASPTDDRGGILGLPSPGLLLFTTFGDTPARGAYVSLAFPERLYVVHRGTLWELDHSGIKTERGTMTTTSGRVSLDDNGTQLMLVDGAAGWILNMKTQAFGPIVDPDFPAGARTVTFLDQVFIVDNPTASGRFNISALLDGFTWNGLDFATAETLPDPLVAVKAHLGYLILFGAASIEQWSGTGGGGFPFARVQGTNEGWGLIARSSVVDTGQSLCFLARNSLGKNALVSIGGTAAAVEELTTPDVSHNWQSYPTVLDATAFAYRHEGFRFLQLNFPAANKSWLYNISAAHWSELTFAGVGRHRAECAAAFGERVMVSDYATGELYILASEVYSDNGHFILREIVSKQLYSDSFNRIKVQRLRLDVETGGGLAQGQGSDPYVGLQVSKDGGFSWGTEIPRSLGKIGEFTRKVEWKRLKSARNYALRWRLSDPVAFKVTGAHALVGTSTH